MFEKVMNFLFGKEKETIPELFLYVAVENEIKKNGIGDFISTFKILSPEEPDSFREFCTDYTKNFYGSNEYSSVCLYKLPYYALPESHEIEKIDFLQKKTFAYIKRKKIIPLRQMTVKEIVNSYLACKLDLAAFDSSLKKIEKGIISDDNPALRFIIYQLGVYADNPEITIQQCQLINSYHLTPKILSLIMCQLLDTQYYRQKNLNKEGYSILPQPAKSKEKSVPLSESQKPQIPNKTDHRDQAISVC